MSARTRAERAHRAVAGYLVLFACFLAAAIGLRDQIDANRAQVSEIARLTHRIARLESQTRAGLAAQTHNRALNVAVWCGAINQGRAYDRAFVHRVTDGRDAYTLADLDCARLEAKTLASTHPHH